MITDGGLTPEISWHLNNGRHSRIFVNTIWPIPASLLLCKAAFHSGPHPRHCSFRTTSPHMDIHQMLQQCERTTRHSSPLLRTRSPLPLLLAQLCFSFHIVIHCILCQTMSILLQSHGGVECHWEQWHAFGFSHCLIMTARLKPHYLNPRGKRKKKTFPAHFYCLIAAKSLDGSHRGM